MKKLYLDIETAWAVGSYWGRSKYEQTIISEIRPWYILSIAYKWDDEKTIHTLALPDFPRYKKDRGDDKALVDAIAKLLDQADYVIAHNGDNFDLKKIKTRIIIHRGRPPSPYKTGDTLKVARREFGFTSNSLEDLCATLGIGRKLPHTGKDLWERCMGPYDPKAWALMRRYNKHDVYLLEAVYQRFKPWMQNHDTTVNGCPKCGLGPLHSRGWDTRATGLRYQKYQCQGCGGWSTSTKGERIS